MGSVDDMTSYLDALKIGSEGSIEDSHSTYNVGNIIRVLHQHWDYKHKPLIVMSLNTLELDVKEVASVEMMGDNTHSEVLLTIKFNVPVFPGTKSYQPDEEQRVFTRRMLDNMGRASDDVKILIDGVEDSILDLEIDQRSGISIAAKLVTRSQKQCIWRVGLPAHSKPKVLTYVMAVWAYELYELLGIRFVHVEDESKVKRHVVGSEYCASMHHRMRQHVMGGAPEMLRLGYRTYIAEMVEKLLDMRPVIKEIMFRATVHGNVAWRMYGAIHDQRIVFEAPGIPGMGTHEVIAERDENDVSYDPQEDLDTLSEYFVDIRQHVKIDATSSAIRAVSELGDALLILFEKGYVQKIHSRIGKKGIKIEIQLIGFSRIVLLLASLFYDKLEFGNVPFIFSVSNAGNLWHPWKRDETNYITGQFDGSNEIPIELQQKLAKFSAMLDAEKKGKLDRAVSYSKGSRKNKKKRSKNAKKRSTVGANPDDDEEVLPFDLSHHIFSFLDHNTASLIDRASNKDATNTKRLSRQQLRSNLMKIIKDGNGITGRIDAESVGEKVITYKNKIRIIFDIRNNGDNVDIRIGIPQGDDHVFDLTPLEGFSLWINRGRDPVWARGYDNAEPAQQQLMEFAVRSVVERAGYYHTQLSGTMNIKEVMLEVHEHALNLMIDLLYRLQDHKWGFTIHIPDGLKETEPTPAPFAFNFGVVPRALNFDDEGNLIAPAPSTPRSNLVQTYRQEPYNLPYVGGEFDSVKRNLFDGSMGLLGYTQDGIVALYFAPRIGRVFDAGQVQRWSVFDFVAEELVDTKAVKDVLRTRSKYKQFLQIIETLDAMVAQSPKISISVQTSKKGDSIAWRIETPPDTVEATIQSIGSTLDKSFKERWVAHSYIKDFEHPGSIEEEYKEEPVVEEPVYYILPERAVTPYAQQQRIQIQPQWTDDGNTYYDTPHHYTDDGNTYYISPPDYTDVDDEVANIIGNGMGAAGDNSIWNKKKDVNSSKYGKKPYQHWTEEQNQYLLSLKHHKDTGLAYFSWEDLAASYNKQFPQFPRSSSSLEKQYRRLNRKTGGVQ